MLTLKPDEQAMRQRLLAVAASHTPETVTYEQLWVAATGKDFREARAFGYIGRYLFHVANYEQRLGRPMLTSLCVAANGSPGDGFFELAAEYGHDTSDPDEMWAAEKDRARRFWSAALDPSAVVRDRFGPLLAWDPTLVGDTATLALFDELKR